MLKAVIEFLAKFIFIVTPTAGLLINDSKIQAGNLGYTVSVTPSNPMTRILRFSTITILRFPSYAGCGFRERVFFFFFSPSLP